MQLMSNYYLKTKSLSKQLDKKKKKSGFEHAELAEVLPTNQRVALLSAETEL